jgi:hypothetical protein
VVVVRCELFSNLGRAPVYNQQVLETTPPDVHLPMEESEQLLSMWNLGKVYEVVGMRISGQPYVDTTAVDVKGSKIQLLMS